MTSPHLAEGSRVALLVPGSPAYLDAVHSLLARGVVPIPLDPGSPPSSGSGCWPTWSRTWWSRTTRAWPR